jgi:surfactin synthase thioesterase subunit
MSRQKIKVYCLPFAGGSKYSYAMFERFNDRGVSFIPIDLPGRGGRFEEKLLYTVSEIVDDVFQQIEEGLDCYAFFGHSMGSVIAYELTHKIIARGLTRPLYLFVSGRAGPSKTYSEKRSWLLSSDDFFKKLQSYGGLPDEVLINLELIKDYEPVLRADFEAIETYQYPNPIPLDIPVKVFIGNREDVTTQDALLWGKESIHETEVIDFDGGHFFIYDNHPKMAHIMIETLNQINMHVPEIIEVKDHLDKLKNAGLINHWELPYENLLTRRSAAIFFVDAKEANLEAVSKELSKYDNFSTRINTEKKLSQLVYRITFSEEEKKKNAEQTTVNL